MSLYTQPYDFTIPPDDGPEIFLSDVEALVDSGEFCDRPRIGTAESGHNVFADALNTVIDDVPGIAHALARAMQGKDPHPGDLEAMRATWELMRPTLIRECLKTACAEAVTNDY